MDRGPLAVSLLLLVACQGTEDLAPVVATAGEAERLIRRDEYTRLIIEVDAVEGQAPREQALAHVAMDLSAVLDKPDGIEAVFDATLRSQGSDHAWTEDELDQLADANYRAPNGSGTALLHVLALDGHSVSDGDGRVTVGLAWGGVQIALFMQSIRETCEGSRVPTSIRERLCEASEYSVLLHEIGHLLGLVNNGVDAVSDHEDPDHPYHCRHEACVMYWAYERQRALDGLRDRFMAGDMEHIGFDPACEQDLAAVRDR